MRVVVDFDKCKSNAVCMGVAPEVFEVRDDGFLYILEREPVRGVPGTSLNEAVVLVSDPGGSARRGAARRPRHRGFAFAAPLTGYFHVGGARTALFNWLFARASRRDLRAPHRGHRPGAERRKLRRRNLQRAPLARDHLGRRAVSPVRAPRALRRGGSKALRRRSPLRVRLHATRRGGSCRRRTCHRL